MAADLPPAQDVLSLAEKVQAFVQQAKEKARDGLSFAEFGQIAMALMRLVVIEVDELSVPGAIKKADVLSAVGLLFDTVADKCVPLVLKPFWWVAKPVARAVILAVLSGVLEGVLPDVRAAS